ncbi:M20 family peptidase [Aestuariibacter sp. AA17]|uniref:M20 family peptidase n=1 Tax=Fluctibacter corallii TaxID=2984329 RepID=A0ABT3AB18_9ALTE|nr:M20 family peptidase [Aestuariibacter sp. AA17]MCV2885869.1 M20 family peptidase [Aestuariibacter sp. AA17]
MKKGLLGLVVTILLLMLIISYRTTYFFKDTQYQPAASLQPVQIDIAAAAQRLSKAIQFKTISYEAANSEQTLFEGEPFIQLAAYLETAFPHVHRAMQKEVINQYSLLYEIEGTNAQLKPALFMGHTDVVPVDEATLNNWTHAPFSGEVTHDAIWGRGAMDDKVTVLALLEAMEQLLAEGLRPKRTIYFAFGHDEEIGGEQGAKLIAEQFKAKGIEFEFVLDEGGAVTQDMLLDASTPLAIIGIAEKGYVNLRLSVNSEGGHSSQPPKHTAAGILSQAIVNLEHNPFPANIRFIHNTISHVGYYAPLSMRLPMANTWLFEPLIIWSANDNPALSAGMRTTTAATMLQGSAKSNILPTQATAVVNFRILPGDSIDSVIAHAKRVIDDDRVNIEAFAGNEPSAVSTTDSMGYRLIEQTIRRLDNNILVAPYLVQGGTDAKHFTQLSDSIYRFMMVTLNPVTMKQFHGVNEHISLDDYARAIQFYYAMLKQTANNEMPE